MEIHITTAVNEFIVSLEESAIAKLLRTIDLLEKFGNQLQLPHSKSIGHGLFELRIHGRKEIRIFYGYHKKRAILLYGFIKKTPQIPRKELNIAQSKLKDISDLT